MPKIIALTGAQQNLTPTMTQRVSLMPSVLPAWQFRTNRRIWLCLGMVMLLELISFYSLGIKFDLPNMSVALLMPGHLFEISSIPIVIWIPFLCCALAAFFFTHIHRNDSARLISHVINQILCIGIAGDMLSYLGAWLNFPLMDDRLEQWDKALGFDWQGYIGWANEHIPAANALSFAYNAYGPQLAIGVLLLFFYGHSVHVQRFLVALCLTCLLTIVTATFFPALGHDIHIFNYIDPNTQNYYTLHTAAYNEHQSIISLMTRLRDHSLTDIPYPAIGIISFPSFHSATATLLIYASLPLRNLRWLAIPLNIAVYFATPINGCHYLADVVTGIVIASMSIVVADPSLLQSKGKNG